MEVAKRRARRALYLRLATVHAGPLGPALLGLPELAPSWEEAYRHCPGAPGLPCQGVGGEPRTCLARRFLHLSRSALRGGRKRRAQEKAMVEGLLRCVAVLRANQPEGFSPVWEATQKALEEDLAYLDQMVGLAQDEHQGHGGRGKDDEEKHEENKA